MSESPSVGRLPGEERSGREGNSCECRFVLTPVTPARHPAREGRTRAVTIAVRRLLFAAAALVAAPALSRAQGIDIQVTGLQFKPPAPRAGDTVSVSATIRRTGTGGPAFKDPVAVEASFFSAGEAKAFAIKKFTLGPDQSIGAEAAWSAQPGQHAIGVRLTRVATLKGQVLKDANPGNDQATVQVLVAPASKGKPDSRSAAPPGNSLPAGAATPGLAAPGAIAGILTVPPDLRARFRVAVEGPGGWRGIAEAGGTGEHRPYRFDGLLPGNYRLEPEALADTAAGPTPGGSWVPRQGQANLRQGERLEGLRGLDFRFEPLRVTPEIGAVPPRPAVPLPPGPPQALSSFDGLRVNGAGFGSPVTVRWGESATVEWNLPGAVGDALHLLVSPAERFGVPYCPSSIGNPIHDSLPGAGRVTPLPRGSVPLPLDRPEYNVNERYYLKGCLMRAGVPTGDETNPVEINFVDDPERREAARPAGPPDLVVREVRLLRGGGGGTGRLAIVIEDLNGSRAARAASFRYEVFFDDETSPRLRGTVAPGQWVGSGVPFLVTEPSGLDGTEPRGGAIVRVVVNGDRAYAETDYANDTLERYVGWEDMMTSARWRDGLQVLKVHEVFKAEEGPSWAVLGVRYTFTTLPPAGEPGPRFLNLTVPTTGPDTVSCRGPVGTSWDPGSPLPRGVNQVQHFLCVASATHPSFLTDTAVVTPRDGTGPPYAPVAERRFRVIKRWIPSLARSGPELPDIKVRVLSRSGGRLRGASPHDRPVDGVGRPTIWYPTSAVGGSIELRYGNWGRVPSREGVGWVHIKEGYPFACDTWRAIVLPSSAVATRPPEGRRSWSGSFPVPPLAPLEARTISVAIDSTAELSCYSHVTIEVMTPDIDASPTDNVLGVRDLLGMPPPETRRDELPRTDAEAWGDPGF